MQRRPQEKQESHHTRSEGLPEGARKELPEVHRAPQSADQHQPRTNVERQQCQEQQVLLAVVELSIENIFSLKFSNDFEWKPNKKQI
jgi:hypothetical protein